MSDVDKCQVNEQSCCSFNGVPICPARLFFLAFAVLPINLYQCRRGHNTHKYKCLVKSTSISHFHHCSPSLPSDTAQMSFTQQKVVIIKVHCSFAYGNLNQGTAQSSHSLKKDPIGVTDTANLHEKHACTLGRGQCLQKDKIVFH